jgi:caffeoyl-CoA O-methyltransferase
MALVKTEVTQEVVDYLARHARSDAVLGRVARETAEMPRAEMATTPDEAALLTMLARLVGARRALELGTFTGYGAISIARGLDDGGRVTDPQDERERVIDALNDRVTADERVESVMVLVADGLTFVRRR